MTKNELITKQQLEIESLKSENEFLRKSHDNIFNIIYCIGGPLNDNKLGYTKEQMMDFVKIKNELFF